MAPNKALSRGEGVEVGVLNGKGSRLTGVISVMLAVLLAGGLLAAIVSCGQKEASEKVEVIVSILPLADFVENVGGEKVEVRVMVPPGANLHAYEPTPSQMTSLARAEMYVKVGSGVEFELVWMDRLIAINREMLVVDSSSGVQLLEVAGTGESKAEHGAIDPHIWLSPLNARMMVRNIFDGLVQVDPDNSAYYERNRDAYLQDLTRLDRDIRDGLAGLPSRVFMVYHPVFGYLAEEYELTIMSVEVDGKEPTASGLARLIEQAKEHNIRVVFASPQFNPQSAEVIARAIDGKLVFFDPLDRDYIMNMRRLLDKLVQAAG